MNKAARISINGLGYIGRLSLISCFEEKNRDLYDVVGINDIMDIENAATLIKYSSNHGRSKVDVSIDYSSSSLVIDGRSIPYFNKISNENLPWMNLDVDIVFECSGKFLTRDLLSLHLIAGAKKVLLSAPTKNDSDADLTVVYGINHCAIREDNKIISNASCTTNAAAHVLYAFESKFSFIHADLTTIHAPTGEFFLMDNANKDTRRSFSAKDNLIPTTTSAADTLLRVMPNLINRVRSEAFYAPFRGASMMDFSILTEKKCSVEEVHKIFYEFRGNNKIIELTNENLVSTSFQSSPYSAIIDTKLTRSICLGDRSLVKIRAWFDAEYGFANRMLDTARSIHNCASFHKTV